MAENPKQMNFFSSLDFPGRTVLYVWEIAQKLGGTVQHYLNLVDTGELVAIDTASRAARQNAPYVARARSKAIATS